MPDYRTQVRRSNRQVDSDALEPVVGYRDKVADLFKSKPNTWIDGLDIAEIGGAYASRTRISECRRQLGMQIVNRVRRKPGSGVKVSEYKFVPSEPAKDLIDLMRSA